MLIAIVLYRYIYSYIYPFTASATNLCYLPLKFIAVDEQTKDEKRLGVDVDVDVGKRPGRNRRAIKTNYSSPMLLISSRMRKKRWTVTKVAEINYERWSC